MRAQLGAEKDQSGNVVQGEGKIIILEGTSNTFTWPMPHITHRIRWESTGPRVVSVAIPLRRVTVLAFVLSVPVLLLHYGVDRVQELLGLSWWEWLCVGTIA